MGHPRLTEEYKAQLWDRYARGESAAVIARAVGRHAVTYRAASNETGAA